MMWFLDFLDHFWWVWVGITILCWIIDTWFLNHRRYPDLSDVFAWLGIIFAVVTLLAFIAALISRGINAF